MWNQSPTSLCSVMLKPKLNFPLLCYPTRLNSKSNSHNINYTLLGWTQSPTLSKLCYVELKVQLPYARFDWTQSPILPRRCNVELKVQFSYAASQPTDLHSTGTKYPCQHYSSLAELSCRPILPEHFSRDLIFFSLNRSFYTLGSLLIRSNILLLIGITLSNLMHNHIGKPSTRS